MRKECLLPLVTFSLRRTEEEKGKKQAKHRVTMASEYVFLIQKEPFQSTFLTPLLTYPNHSKQFSNAHEE